MARRASGPPPTALPAATRSRPPRPAVGIANEARPGLADTVTFAIPTTDPGYNPTTGQFTITLTSGELLLSHDMTILGPGADRLAVSGNYTSRVFEINTPDLTAP